MGQITVVYGFIADVSIFDERFTALEIIGSILVLVFNISAIVFKLLEKK